MLLQLELAGNSIEADVQFGAPSDGDADSRVVVSQGDVIRAIRIVDDFNRRGGRPPSL